jgi:GNAT superfamily N-acetyltransferase
LGLTGTAIAPFLPDLAALRIQVFRDFPYLYDGDPDYEQAYLQTYIAAQRAAVFLACDGERIVGATTCLPLVDETPNVQKPFQEAGRDVSSIFYFGESVLAPPYRGRGIGVRFFEAREAHARSFGTFEEAAFCAVNRPEHHQLRPATYTPLDRFWTRRGFTRQPDLVCRMSWRDIGETDESEKSLTFWTKRL